MFDTGDRLCLDFVDVFDLYIYIFFFFFFFFLKKEGGGGEGEQSSRHEKRNLRLDIGFSNKKILRGLVGSSRSRG